MFKTSTLSSGLSRSTPARRVLSESATLTCWKQSSKLSGVESDEIRDRLRTDEQAAAAPYLNYPTDPWWVVPGFGVAASLFVLGVNLHAQPDVSDWVGTALQALVVVCAWGYAWWQRRRRGTMPSGRAPREVNRALWGFIVGAVVVAVALFVLADWTPLWVGTPAAFVLASAGMLWFGRAYDRASAKARERLV